jgi:hypothetical protein
MKDHGRHAPATIEHENRLTQSTIDMPSQEIGIGNGGFDPVE